MRLPRMWSAAVTALAVIVLTAPAGARAQANEVAKWNEIATRTLSEFPPAAGVIHLNMAMSQGAVYDAVNSIERTHRPYLLWTRFHRRASTDAAAATAAYRVLSDIVASVPATVPFANRTALLDRLAADYATTLAAMPDTRWRARGIAAGDAAAAAMLVARRGDGRFAASPWVPSSAPGHWQPLLNPDGTPMLDPTPWIGEVRPFLIESSSQFRTAGPPALSSAAWARDFNEVKALGSVASTVRTPEQTDIALFWQSNVAPTWNAVARDLVLDPRRGVDLSDSARLLAMMNLSAADAVINCWNDKYHWDFWRPWQAVREAGADGNPATEPDGTWTALLTAPYPEHPSGHLCLDGAHVRALQMFFGTDKIEFDAPTARPPVRTRHFNRLSHALDEIVEARIWAGLHFRTADLQARRLGGQVADYMARHHFQPRR